MPSTRRGFLKTIAGTATLGLSDLTTLGGLRAFADEKEVKAGALINGSRVVLTGQAVAPSLFAVMRCLGKSKTVERLGRVEELVPRALGLRSVET